MNKTILIVDDSSSVREVVSHTLQTAGYHVIARQDGDDALTSLDGSPIHLVITDLNMPNMDGISLTKAIRTHEAYKFTPILLLTTESQDEKKKEAKAAGATGWLVKPFVSEKLLEVVKKVIR